MNFDPQTITAEQLADPSVTQADLASVAAVRPDLWGAIAAHPQAYPALKEWIAQQQAAASAQAAGPQQEAAQQEASQQEASQQGEADSSFSGEGGSDANASESSTNEQPAGVGYPEDATYPATPSYSAEPLGSESNGGAAQYAAAAPDQSGSYQAAPYAASAGQAGQAGAYQAAPYQAPYQAAPYTAAPGQQASPYQAVPMSQTSSAQLSSFGKSGVPQWLYYALLGGFFLLTITLFLPVFSFSSDGVSLGYNSFSQFQGALLLLCFTVGAGLAVLADRTDKFELKIATIVVSGIGALFAAIHGFVTMSRLNGVAMGDGSVGAGPILLGIEGILFAILVILYGIAAVNSNKQ